MKNSHLNTATKYLLKGLNDGGSLMELSDIIHAIEEGGDIHVQTQQGWTWIHKASYWGRLAYCEELLKRGAEIERVTQNNETPLQISIRNRHSEVTLFLLDHGANPNEIYPFQSVTPLTIEAGHGNLVVCQKLIEKGADVNAMTEETPLISAIRFNQKEVVELLLKEGADVNATPPKSAFTPLLCALYNRSIDIVTLLLEKGASVHQLNCLNQSPLSFTILNTCSIPLTQLLLDHGADPTEPSGEGKTPLSLAIELQQLALTDLLQEAVLKKRQEMSEAIPETQAKKSIPRI